MDRFDVITVEKGIRQVGPHRWEVRVYAGRNPETGAIRHVSRGTTKGIKDARAIKARLATEVAAGKHGSRSGTFGELLDAWLRDGKQGRSPSTLAGYRIKIETAIRPALGSVLLEKLTARDLDRWYARLLAGGTSPAMVMHYHRVISAALRQAEKWQMVPVSVARNASPPTVPAPVTVTPPPDRVRTLIDLAGTTRNPEFATVLFVAALTGMRRGELAGLRWSDIDWQGSALTVTRSIWQTAGGWGPKDPKTHQVRRLDIGPATLAALRGRWERATSAAQLAEVELVADAYVFSPDLTGDRPTMPDAMTQAFRRLCDTMAEKTGDPWPYRLHDLRHYSATELVAAGHSMVTVSKRLGHAKVSTTSDIYAHDTNDQAVAAAASLEAGLAG
ncbi:MAG: site-specific integrase [Acidimicrobiales bacterium]|nr:site-specific integrase [Acidimicrobiales bacterium]